MKVYEIVKVCGLGLIECPNEYFSTGIIFKDKEVAEKTADEMWKNNTTEEDRKSGWCALKYIVEERELR
jgi:hypothetical protein